MKAKDSRYAACRFLVPALLLLLLAAVPTPVFAQGGLWVEKTPTSFLGGFGEAIVGTGTSIYAIRCYSSGQCQFQRYDPTSNSWTSLLTVTWNPGKNPPPDDPPPRTKSGTALAWDRGDCIYALLGAAGADSDRRYFYRYTISSRTWQPMAPSPHAQGAGDALTWSGYEKSVYAMLGSNDAGRGSGFARYYPSNNTWKTLTFNPSWTVTDDGASLVWTGGEYLYALRGEWEETTPHNDFARYHIPTSTWQNMAGIPVGTGVGDGASLLWVGNWVSAYSDHIFALGGNDVLENPGYGFYAYSISRNQWTSLQSLPSPVVDYDGNRLGFAAGHIYYWQGSPSSHDTIPVPGGGSRFYMFSGYKLVITVYTSSVAAGSWSNPYTVQRQDENGNLVTSGSTTVYLASTSTGANKKFAETSGGPAVTSVTIPDGSSTKDFCYYDEKAGSWTISVSSTDMTGDSKSLTVNPGSLASFTLSGYPSSVTAGQSFGTNDIVVTAYDAYNNVKTDYTGQVWFTSSDSQAVLPYTPAIKYTFTTADSGVHPFAGADFILKTAGSRTITITDGTISKTSSSITVNPAWLDHIVLSPDPETVTAGSSVTYTAAGFDAYGNSLGDVTGSVASWSIVESPADGGVWLANMYTSKASGTWTVKGVVSESIFDTATLTVNPSALHHFVFDPISSPQTAGTAFSVTVTAKDQWENTVLSYAGTPALSASTGPGTITPTGTDPFSSGAWSGPVTVTKAQSGVSITATDGAVSGTSGPFDVGPAALHHFKFASISSSKTAGVSFSITITGEDAYGNTVTGYVGSNSLSDSTGTLNPTTTSAFVSGVWSGEATITKAQLDVKISTTGDSKFGESNSFAASPAELHHFDFDAIGTPQTAGTSFSITITAKDRWENTVLSYVGTNALSDLTETISPVETGAFTNGAWSDSVTITKVQLAVKITTAGEGKSGESNSFDVVPGALDHIVVSPKSATVVAGGTETYTAAGFDAYGNSLGDVTGLTGWSIEAGAGGSWSANVYTSEKAGAWTVTGTYSGKSDIATLDVNPGSLHNFTFDTISSPQTVGSDFSITITAKDQYENTVTSYIGSNTLSDSTGTISPTGTGAFASGSWTGSVTISTSQSNVVVTTSGDGKSGTSNGFDINTTPACAETATGTGAACLNPDASVITTLTAVSESSLPREGKPNIVFPHGFFSFRIAGLALGARVTVTMTLPSPVPVGTQYWKYGPTPDNHTPHWYQLPIGDDDGDNVITITLTDNGLGDDILTGQDGQIVDQGGPGIQRDPGPTGGPVGGVLMPVNKPAILVPYIVLFGVVTTVAVVVVVPSKKRKN